VLDPVKNPVRIIDYIRGKSLYNLIADLTMPHEQYYHEVLPDLMARLIGSIEALAAIHRQGQHHGDVRNDHILVHAETGRFIWIDFDFEVNFSDYDIWSMGNILTYVVGNGSHTFYDVKKTPERYPLLQGSLDNHDAVFLLKHRIANLRKLFPYLSRDLNDILLRFSAGSMDFYDGLDSQLRDLKSVFAL
jgi:hypothetical protein